MPCVMENPAFDLIPDTSDNDQVGRISINRRWSRMNHSSMINGLALFVAVIAIVIAIVALAKVSHHRPKRFGRHDSRFTKQGKYEEHGNVKLAPRKGDKRRKGTFSLANMSKMMINFSHEFIKIHNRLSTFQNKAAKLNREYKNNVGEAKNVVKDINTKWNYIQNIVKTQKNSSSKLTNTDYERRLNNVEAELEDLTDTINLMEDELRSIREELNEKKSKQSSNEDIDTRQLLTLSGHEYSLTPEPWSWIGARNACLSIGADLATAGIKSMESRIILANGFKTRQVWVGLSNYNSPKDWVWIDGAAATPTEIIWAPGKPTNYSSQTCGAMHTLMSDWKMDNINCTARLFGLCEKRSTNITTD